MREQAKAASRFSALLVLVTVGLAAGCGSGELPGSPGQTASSEIPSPAATGSGQPHLASAADGTVVLSWIEPTAGGHALRFAVLGEEGWSAPRTLASGGDWFVNWADFPSVVPISDTLWAAHWLVKSADATYAYDVVMAVSRDAGRSWSSPFRPHDDGTPTEHGFASLFPWDGAVGAVWLDGRNMASGGHGSGGMTLRSARISASGEVLEGSLLDELVCDCCQTDAVVTADGPLVAYRNRSDQEIRDIQVLAAGRGGSPRDVHTDGWRIAGCPVNGPALARYGENVAVAWFTAAGAPRVNLALSADGGRSFVEPIPVDEDAPLGRVDVVMLADGAAIVSWVRDAGEARGELCVRRIGADGRPGAILTVSAPEPSRQIGFPQMALASGELVLAWTAATADGRDSRIRTVRIPVSKI